VAAAGVTGFVDAVGQFEMHGLLVVKRGMVVAEAEWAPYRLREPVLMYSLSKGFTSAAVGLAVAEGLLSLDDRVLDHLPEYADRAVSELRDLRIRHVLTMSSGHDRDLLGGISDPSDLSTDLVELLLSTPPAHAPGSWFQYNQPATFTTAAIVQRRASVRLLDYLRTRLFEPFDAAEPLSWIADSQARDIGFPSVAEASRGRRAGRRSSRAHAQLRSRHARGMRPRGTCE
jgi:CubicO group peptidase (beta-lactamase class C family)